MYLLLSYVVNVISIIYYRIEKGRRLTMNIKIPNPFPYIVNTSLVLLIDWSADIRLYIESGFIILIWAIYLYEMYRENKRG